MHFHKIIKPSPISSCNTGTTHPAADKLPSELEKCSLGPDPAAFVRWSLGAHQQHRGQRTLPYLPIALQSVRSARRPTRKSQGRFGSLHKQTHTLLPLPPEEKLAQKDALVLTEADIRETVCQSLDAPTLPSNHFKGGSYAQFQASAIKEARSWSGMLKEYVY